MIPEKEYKPMRDTANDSTPTLIQHIVLIGIVMFLTIGPSVPNLEFIIIPIPKGRISSIHTQTRLGNLTK